MSAREFVERLSAIGIVVRAEDDQLRFRAPKGAMTPTLLAELKERKADVLRWLAEGGALDLPLSAAQRRMWFLNQLQPDTAVYNVHFGIEMEGALDAAALSASFRDVMARHWPLRASFRMEGGQLLQRAPAASLEVTAHDLRPLDSSARSAELARLGRGDAEAPFDLTRGPLLRASLVHVEDGRHVLFVTMHHIITDGTSVALFFEELASAYAARVGHHPSLPALEADYADFIREEQRALSTGELAPKLEAYAAKLAAVPTLDLPFRRAGAGLPSGRGARVPFSFSRDEVAALRELGRRAGCSLFMTILAGFSTLLHRYSGQEDFALGTFGANREERAHERLLGLFMNTVVLRCDFAGEPDFHEVLARTRSAVLGALGDQSLPFDELVQRARPNRERGASPMFRAAVVMDPRPVITTAIPQMRWTPIVPTVDMSVEGTAKVDVLLKLAEQDGAIEAEIEVDADRYDVDAVRRAGGHLKQLLLSAVADPRRPVSALSMLGQEERRQLLETWNDTARPYRRGVCLHALIREQALRTSAAEAVRFRGEALDYAALEARSNQLAHHLRSLGAGPGALVGVCLRRSISLLVAVLAAMKAGAAYVPLEPGYPRDRLAFMAEDAKVTVLVTEPACADAAPRGDAALVILDGASLDLSAYPTDPPESGATEDDVAYVIYTSGSTGRPKGVANTHAGICNRLFWMQEALAIGPSDRVLQKTPFGFDVSVWELFWPLMTGACLVMAEPEGHRDPAYLVDVIERESITTLHFVPSMLQAFLDGRDLHRCGSLRRVILSGEALAHDLQERFFAAPIPAELYNLYGPTEAAVDVTWWDCREDRRRDPVPIGRPIANIQIYILDARGEPTPADVPGRLHIGGVGVARGYIHRPELTEAAFVPDPFAGEPGARMYFTGDLARWRADGTIEFLGRIDHQVKIGGCRIELGEIESAIRAQPGVRDCAVLAHRDSARGDRLLAYVVPAVDTSVDGGAIRAALGARLPAFMLPAQIIPLASLPLSPNGKLDRAALPAPDATARVTATGTPPREAPSSALALRIAEVWADVLGVAVDPEKSFFDLGGTSLLIVHANRLLRERLGLDVTVAEMFNHATAAALARHASPEEAPARGAAAREPAAADEPVAIIGVGCRFPGGARDPDAFWALLHGGVDAICEVPRDRWDIDALYDPDPDAPGKMNSRWGGFIADVETFEPAFFGISPREAESLDPQHRLLLEVAFEALEDAGRASSDLRGSDTGVYVGVCSFDHQAKAVTARPLEALDGHVGSGNVDSMASGRLSYWLGVHGPSISVDTACSSSLVSVHLACQALRAGECGMALAGGVNLVLSPTWGVYLARTRMGSPTGRCRAFDASADGYVRSEGCGMIVLKRLSDAERDGDRVLAIIRGSALNQDGRSATLTAPNGVAQEAVLRRALAQASLSPADVDYVEAHGTGTPLGDPIEIEALAAVFGEGRAADRPIVVGSVKTNFGHAEGAAGVAGLIKVVLALQHGEIPKSLHFSAPNPHIPWASLPVRVADERLPWPRGERLRRAGVSSFGFSGTNAHILLEEAPARRDETESVDRALHVLALSARTEEALVAQAARVAGHLDAHPEQAIADLCHSVNVGRASLDHRAAIVAGSLGELREELAALALGAPTSRRVVGPAAAPARRARVAFLFTGQGAQYAGMGRGLYETQPVFRGAIDRAAAWLDGRLPRPLLSVLYGEDTALLDDTTYTQPALFAIEHALAALWESWGIRPDLVLGHSVGEVVAACVAGIFSLEDGLSLIVGRGRLMGALPPGGAMVSLRASEERVRAALVGLTDRASIAAVNAADQIVVSGAGDAVAAVVARLAAEGVRAKPLSVSHAFHSPLMDPMLAPFEEIARSIRYAPASIPVLSNVDAALSGEAMADPAYWVRHARAPVRFADGIAALRAREISVAIEIGPHPTLAALGSRSEEDVAWLPSLRRDHHDWETLLGSVAKLHTLGVSIDWRGFDAPYARRRVSLPAYPFQRTAHGLQAPTGIRARTPARRLPAGYALAGEAIDLPTAAIHRVLPLGLDHQPYLIDHVLHGEVVVPGAFYLAVVIAIASERFGDGMFVLRDVMFVNPLILRGDTELHVALTPEREGRYAIELASPTGDGGWRQHLTGALEIGRQSVPQDCPPARLAASCPEEHAPLALYERIAEQGIDLRPGWRWIEHLRTGADEIVARIVPPATAASVGPLHPTLLDNSFVGAHVRTLATQDAADRDLTPRVPFSVRAMRVYRPATGLVHCHGVVRPEVLAGSTIADIVLVDDAGHVVAELEGFTTRRAPPEAIRRVREAAEGEDLHEIAWRPAVIAANVASPGASSGLVLLLADPGSALAHALARGIEARGGRCVIAEPGAAFASLGEDRYAVDPRSPAGFESLLSALDGDGDAVREVIWQWGTDSHAAGEGLWEASRALVTGALHLVQALLRRPRAAPPRLCWLTRGAQGVPGADRASAAGNTRALAQAPLLGFARALLQEHPEIAGTMIDLDPDSDLGSDDPVALLDAIAAGGAGVEAAYRSGQRLVPSLVALQIPEERPALIESEGAVLITGGLGGLGLEVARWLVTSGTARHLALLGRHLPGEAQQAALEELRALGATVRTIAADVGDPASLDEAWIALQEGPPLEGVIHAAGVLDDGVLLQQDAARFDAVLSAKVRGAWALHERTAALPLRFFVLFSSASALLGARGQANYAAANAFLTALAHHRRSLGLPALSIAWGPWADVGMAAALPSQTRERLGLRSMAPARAVHLFGLMLAQSRAEVAALRLDLPALEKQSAPVPVLLRPLLGARPPAAQPRRTGGGKLAAELAGRPAAERKKIVTSALQAEVARILRLASASEVVPHRALQEQGLDSLMAMELRSAVSALVDAPIPATLAFDYPTVEAVTAYLLDGILKIDETATSPEKALAPAIVAARAAGPRWDEPIAIIGIGCRFPGGANDLDSFWRLLDTGTDAVREVPKDRWDVDALYDPDPDAAGKTTTRYGAFLDGVDLFEPTFFGIAPREALALDPQQRILMEVTWEALEHAGLPPASLSGTPMGVFVALITHDYYAMNSFDLEKLDGYLVTGNGSSVASGRLSYLFGLKGPSLTIDTACSSSLVAIHLACQSLRAGECSAALAGGATVLLSPLIHVEFSRLRAMSPDGRCKTFDASADGVGWGDGCGMLVLKRLSDAERDGDRVLAVLRGTAVNQDGKSNGLTSPHGPSQQAVIRSALAQAGLAPADIDYVEAHGTGTPLGDPIEVQALGAVLGEGRSPDRPVVLGSVKTNFGHTQAAAGVAGVIKAVLSLERERIPKNVHFSVPSPHIPWAELPVRVAAEPVPWPAGRRLRRAGVSSFGISGTNAHVILEEAPPKALAERRAEVERPLHVVTISGAGEGALRDRARQLQAHLSAHPELAIADVGYTANARRGHFRDRLAVLAESREQAITSLASALSGGKDRNVVRGPEDGAERVPRVAFLFTGQGAQHPGMGRELYETQPVFRQALERCAEVLDGLMPRPLTAVLFPGEGEGSLLDDMRFSQPAVFALQYALSELWQSWGVVPEAVLGHSAGELAAACVAGVFSLEDGLRLIAARGRLMSEVPPGGAMVAVAADEVRVRELLRAQGARAAQVAIAAVNAPEAVVLSGPAEIVHSLAAQLKAEGIDVTTLRIWLAAHSPLMEPMERPFDEVARGVAHAAPRLKLVSNVSGEILDGSPMDPGYWVEHLRSPVRFADGVQALVSSGVDTLIEIGPHPVLVAMARAGAGAEGRVRLALPSLQRDHRDSEVLLHSLASLYTHGAAIDWDAFDRHGARSLVTLPTYPFQRARYWRAPANGGTSAGVGSAALDRLAKLDATALADLLRGAGDLSAVELLLAPKMLRAFAVALDKLRVEQAAPSVTYTLEWRQSPQSGSTLSARAAEGSWLILVDRAGFGDTVADAIEALGGRCFRVRADEPDAADAIEHGWARVSAQAGPLRGLVNLWCLDVPEPGSPADVEPFQRAILALLTWTRLAIAAPTKPATWWATSGAVAIGPSEIVRSPGQAALWGLGRSLSAEQPDAWGGLVDLPADPGEAVARAFVRALVEPDGEDLTALRAEGRYAQRLASRDLSGAPAWKPRPGGTWLITGGLGALGMHVARWLAAQGVARLILTSRRGEASPGAVEAMASLRALGADVEVTAVDAADSDRMAEVIRAVDTSASPLRGVVHTAGVGRWSTLDVLAAEELREVMSAKIAGALSLDALTRGRDLDAFICFSSAASVWPSPSQGAYAAANAYLDAFAQRAAAEGRRVLSLNWGPWSGGGMASEERIVELGAQGVHALSPEQSLAALARAVGSGRPQVVIANVDWARLQALVEARGRRPIFDELASAAEAPVAKAGLPARGRGDLRERLRASEAPRSLLLEWLRETVADVLGFPSAEQVPLRAGFFSLGMDSMMTVNLRDRLQRALDLRVPTSVAFNHPSIEALTSYLFDRLVGEGVAGKPSAEAGAAGRAARVQDAPPETAISEDALSALLDEKLNELSAFLD